MATRYVLTGLAVLVPLAAAQIELPAAPKASAASGTVLHDGADLDGRRPEFRRSRLQQGPVDFAKQVLPIFKAKCTRCHGPQQRGGKLDMRSIDAILEGGNSGPAIEPGDPSKSLLIELIHFNEMPPKKDKGPRVTKDELELLKRWVKTFTLDSK